MLEKLCIRHYALIEDAEISFSEGLTVLTGETGAGKSIIMGALSLLLGDKADATVVRSGCDSASVSATFSFDSVPSSLADCLSSMDVSLDEGTLVLSRSIRVNGRSTIAVQGMAKTRTELQQIGAALVDVSAQKDHQSLFQSAKQREVLDSYAHDGETLASYRSHYDTLQNLKRQSEGLKASIASLDKENDYLSFASNEIEKAQVKSGEDDRIASEVKIIGSYEQIHDELEEIVSLLHGGEDEGVSAVNALRDAAKSLQGASRLDDSLSSLASRLESVSIESQDIYETVRDYLEKMSFSQEKLDQLQSRLGLLQRLKKKYGGSLDSVLAFLADAKAKLEVGRTGEEQLQELTKKMKGEEASLQSSGKRLSQERKKAALVLSRDIEGVLHQLGMERAVFTIDLKDTSPCTFGMDDIIFSICANPGLESRPIASVASGGELSRILLALKAVLDKDDPVGTLVFDEVDSGIGGKVAASVGEELKRLKGGHQVIAITHLASIAAMADHHLLVEKRVENGTTKSGIREIRDEERVEEIARMLSGDTSPVTLAHARQLLRS